MKWWQLLLILACIAVSTVIIITEDDDEMEMILNQLALIQSDLDGKALQDNPGKTFYEYDVINGDTIPVDTVYYAYDLN